MNNKKIGFVKALATCIMPSNGVNTFLRSDNVKFKLTQKHISSTSLSTHDKRYLNNSAGNLKPLFNFENIVVFEVHSVIAPHMWYKQRANLTQEGTNENNFVFTQTLQLFTSIIKHVSFSSATSNDLTKYRNTLTCLMLNKNFSLVI